MSFGITCLNNSGELTVTSEAITLGYLGKATLVSLHHYSGTTTSSGCGTAVWQFSSTGPIVACIALQSSGQAGAVIEGITRHDASTWYIQVTDQTTATEGPSSSIQYGVPSSTSEIFVFGPPASVSGYGMALYDASGNLTVDLSKPLFTPLSRVSMVGQLGYTATLSSTPIKPAVVGYPNISVNTHTTSTASHQNGMWHWSGGTSFSRTNYLVFTEPDSGGTSSNTTSGCTCIVIEANGLT